MKLKHLASHVALLSSLALLGACGHPASNAGAADPVFESNVPSYSLVSLDIDSTDATASQSALIAETGSGLSPFVADAGEPCHPHLFERTHEVVQRLNADINASLHHISDVIANHPKVKSGTEHQWENVSGTIDRRFTLTKDSTGTKFTYKLELATVAKTENFVTIFSGETDIPAPVTDGGTSASASGNMSFDFSALKTVIPATQASGSFAYSFNVVKGVSKAITITFTNYVPGPNDKHGPRNGTYVYFAKPGVGGSMEFSDSLVLFCPANPTQLVATVDVVSQWLHTDGGISGRSDARGLGGQIASGNTWEGVACHLGPTVSADTETYWMMKVEQADGGTLTGSSVASNNFTASACNPAFGASGNLPVPDLADATNDFPFASTFDASGNLTATTPYYFPLIHP